MKLTKKERINRIHNRIRKKLTGTSERPRLSVFRSNRAIYCQVINDLQGHTIASASSSDPRVQEGKTKIDQARIVGRIIAEKALAANVSTIVFDRGGFLYHGRVKALAEGAREAGLNF